MYDLKPEGMIAYLRYNGYHFNKKMCEWAVKKMRMISPTTGKEERLEMLPKEKSDMTAAMRCICATSL